MLSATKQPSTSWTWQVPNANLVQSPTAWNVQASTPVVCVTLQLAMNSTRPTGSVTTVSQTTSSTWLPWSVLSAACSSPIVWIALQRFSVWCATITTPSTLSKLDKSLLTTPHCWALATHVTPPRTTTSTVPTSTVNCVPWPNVSTVQTLKRVLSVIKQQNISLIMLEIITVTHVPSTIVLVVRLFTSVNNATKPFNISWIILINSVTLVL